MMENKINTSKIITGAAAAAAAASRKKVPERFLRKLTSRVTPWAKTERYVINLFVRFQLILL